MTLSIDRQVAQLAAEGHQEIAVIKLPSQATRKSRKPSKRTPSHVTNAVSQTVYTKPRAATSARFSQPTPASIMPIEGQQPNNEQKNSKDSQSSKCHKGASQAPSIRYNKYIPNNQPKPMTATYTPAQQTQLIEFYQQWLPRVEAFGYDNLPPGCHTYYRHGKQLAKASAAAKAAEAKVQPLLPLDCRRV